MVNLRIDSFCDYFDITHAGYLELREAFQAKATILGVYQRHQGTPGHEDRWDDLLRFARTSPWLEHSQHELTPSHPNFDNEAYTAFEGKMMNFLTVMRINAVREKVKEKRKAMIRDNEWMFECYEHDGKHGDEEQEMEKSEEEFSAVT